MLIRRLLFFSIVSFFFSVTAVGQIHITVPLEIHSIENYEITKLAEPQINADNYSVFELEYSAVISTMENTQSGVISLPHPNGERVEYTISKNTTMADGLKNKFPSIRTYDGFNLDHQSKLKLDVTEHGLHAMIMTPNDGVYFIDPMFKGETQYYMVYKKSEFHSNKLMDCSFSGSSDFREPSNTIKSFVTCDLRTYDVAISATVEYSDFHGGTVPDALSAQVTSMNRVNGVFERDLAVTMTIVANNDQIIFTGDPNLDPFSNGNPGNMINENQTVCDNIIGSANYDIGHVFGTNSGGLAGLGVICVGGQKARGVTGSSAPIGDPFDIDYVAHEMGHQFGANHTQNNGCNRNNATAMEPGSASTIMGYAGICAPNVQSNSDDHFHGISLEEMSNRILNTGCATITALSNNAPIIQSTNGNVTVPAGTPFALTADVTDADGDVLQYCWEQMNNEVSTQPPLTTSTSGPNFRSNSPVSTPTRYFPNLIDLSNGGPFTWEVVPEVSRVMDFRVTVRDQPLGTPGCNDFADVTVSTDAGSGPFVVTYPSATGIVWNASTSETVLWDVANTDVAPVSCTNVDIYLSTDGGNTYPTLLADDVPNTGSAPVTVPNLSTTTARTMVMSSTGTFFDISDNNFEIVALAFDYTLSVNPTIAEVCQPDDATFTIDIGSVDGYNDPVSLSVTGLPAGVAESFSVNPVTPIGSSVLTLTDTDLAIPGTYTITVVANSTSGSKTEDLTLTIIEDNPPAITLLSPLNGETGTATPTTFDWSIGAGAISYEVEIATDNSFTNIVDQATGIGSNNYTSTALNIGTQYFWRVRYINACSTSPWSNTFEFTTSTCIEYPSNDIPVTIPNSGTVTSTVTVPASGNILDINVPVMQISHGRIEQLTLSLTSPQGTTVNLMDQICTNGTNGVNIGYDDDVAPGAIPCPPNDGNSYQPQGLLSDFIGENPTGTWTLTIIDNSNPTGGQLDAWTLEVCSEVLCNEPDIPTTNGDITICSDGAAVPQITGGNLNDATNWEWYEGSCGGTNVGSGLSINVSPTSTTTYYVRGEGGCTTPGVCSEITVFVNPVYSETDAVTICTGDSYIFGSQTLSTSGTYTEVFNSIDGCDSTVVLTLDVINEFNETDEVSICDGNSYSFGSQTLTSAGTYTETFTSAAGCDSTVVLTLTLNPTYNETAQATICTGDSYVFGSQTLSVAGSYTEVFSSIDGCDSTVILTLDVVNQFNETDEVTICDGDSYAFGSQTLTTAGTYTELFTSNSGCDSTVVLTLTVAQGYNETVDASICQGQSYQFGNLNLNSAGAYTQIFNSVDGCDSVVVLTLSVYDNFLQEKDVVICEGESYIFPDGSTGSTTQTNTSILTSENGCDSTIITHLSVESLDLSVTQNGGTLIANQTNATYQWFNCDSDQIINGETGTSYTATSAGNYAVIVTSGNCTDTSDCYNVDFTDLEMFISDDLTVYPNPTDGKINLNWSGKVDRIEVYDAVGRLITRIDSNESNVATIDLSQVERGVYYFRLYHNAGIHNVEIIKN